MLPSFKIQHTGLLLITFLLTQVCLGQRNLKDIPDPDPEVERATFVIPEGFEVNLYASDPQLAKPIHMNFDAKGQLWIASSEVYPQIKPGQKATDKIIVLKDSTGDGKADQRTVFVDNLLIPTGVVPGDGGVYVANSTDLVHYSDTDGDGKADRTRVVLSGFGTEDTHHLLHTLRWGPDGALYMNQSIYIHSHVETPMGVKRLLGGGIWRFRPETMELEVFCRGFVNPWGHHFDYWGQSFATDGAYVEGINYVFPGAVFAAAPNEPRRLKGLNPGSPKHCGLEILSGRHLPESWRGTMVANDFRGNRVCRFEVSENASGYASNQVTEVIKSSHVAFRPIDVKMGPDGAIYIADWYNPIIQHGEVDFRDERRDHVHGRIWRVTAKQRPTLKAPEYESLSIPQLLKLLEAPEDWVRLYAKLELKTREQKDVVDQIGSWIEKLDPASDLYDHNLLEAMWAYQNVLHVDAGLVEQLAKHSDHKVRAAAIRLASVRRDKVSSSRELFLKGVTDDHPRVRLESVRALAEDADLRAVSAVASVLELPMDRFLDFAVWRALRDNRAVWLPSVQSGEFTFGGNSSALLFALQSIDNSNAGKTLATILAEQKSIQDSTFDLAIAIGQYGDSASVHDALEWLATAGKEYNSELAKVATSTVIESCRVRKVAPAAAAEIAELYVNADWKLQLINAGINWKLDQLYPLVYDNARGKSDLKLTAISALGNLATPQSKEILMSLAASSARDIRIASIRSLSQVSVGEAVKAQLRDMEHKDSVASETLPSILASQKGRALFLDGLATVSLPTDNAKQAVTIVRSTGNELPQIIAALRKAGNVDASGWVLSDELKHSLAIEVKQQGDPHNGQAIYRRKSLQCMQCHGIGGAGGKVGPDLISIGASAPTDYLVESLIAPNAKIKENFHAVQILDVDGQITSGIIIQSDDNNIQLRTAKNEIVNIAKADIDLQRESRSLMPDGTVDELTRKELVDLVAFLSQLGKIGDFAPSKERYGRSWQVLLHSGEANRVLNRTGIDSATKDAEQFQWANHYATVQGYVPTDVLPIFKPHTGANPISFLRNRLEVTQAGELQITVENGNDLLLWVNGKPTPILEGNVVLTLPVGTHKVVVGVQHANREAKNFRINADTPEGSSLQFQWN